MPRWAAARHGPGAGRDLIRIDAGPGPVVRPGGKIDPYKFYRDYYRS